jgi:hypothetical protein
MVADFATAGYARFDADPELAAWAEAVLPEARAAVRDADLRARWLTCQGTWFVGVDALANDERGAVGGSGPLAGAAIGFAERLFGRLPLHRAQVSVVWPGYPRPREGESEAAFGFRLNRDAAHLDGLKAQGPAQQRRIDETHAWIMGIPLTASHAGASPMVVWQGSHEIMRAALLAALEGVSPVRWPEVDLTAAYVAARREVFETCPRVELSAGPGEAYVLHRLCLHGVAPWRGAPIAEGRMIAYFRPALPGGAGPWLRAA